MANTPQGGRASPLLRAAILLAVATAAHAQGGFIGFQGYLDYVTGVCPSYQTSPNFTQSFIDQMRATEEGYILALSTGNSDSCQRLSFISEQEFKYSFIDIANFPRTYISSYEVNLANLTHPAQIKLNMLPGLLGADTRGRLSLKPVMADEEKLVVAACWQRGYFKREQLQVFIPYESTASEAAIKADLEEQNVVGAGALGEVSQNCNPGLRRAPQPIPLRFYNLILALDNQNRAPRSPLFPVSGTSRSANQATFRSAVTEVDPALNSYYDFQQPHVSNFDPQFSSAYPPYSVPDRALPYFAPQGAVSYSARTGAVPYSAPQGAHVNPTGSLGYFEAKLDENHYTKFYL